LRARSVLMVCLSMDDSSDRCSRWCRLSLLILPKASEAGMNEHTSDDPANTIGIVWLVMSRNWKPSRIDDGVHMFCLLSKAFHVVIRLHREGMHFAYGAPGIGNSSFLLLFLVSY
jgi:hypothetical protein